MLIMWQQRAKDVPPSSWQYQIFVNTNRGTICLKVSLTMSSDVADKCWNAGM